MFREQRDDGSWRAYDINAVMFKEPNGACYTSYKSRRDITFPYHVPDKPEVVEVDEVT